MKSLVIKTALNTIYVANGKVTLVRDNKNGRFVVVRKFANIINNLIVKAKNADNAIRTNKGFYYSVTTKLAIRSFRNVAKMATTLLGEVRVYTSRNYAQIGFDSTILSLYA